MRLCSFLDSLFFFYICISNLTHYDLLSRYHNKETLDKSDQIRTRECSFPPLSEIMTDGQKVSLGRYTYNNVNYETLHNKFRIISFFNMHN